MTAVSPFAPCLGVRGIMRRYGFLQGALAVRRGRGDLAACNARGLLPSRPQNCHHFGTWVFKSLNSRDQTLLERTASNAARNAEKTGVSFDVGEALGKPAWLGIL
jgi:hypothetical protein